VSHWSYVAPNFSRDATRFSEHRGTTLGCQWVTLNFGRQKFRKPGVSVRFIIMFTVIAVLPWGSYPLVNVYSLRTGKWPFIVSFPIKKWWFPIVMLVYQRVPFPHPIWWSCQGSDWGRHPRKSDTAANSQGISGGTPPISSVSPWKSAIIWDHALLGTDQCKPKRIPNNPGSIIPYFITNQQWYFYSNVDLVTNVFFTQHITIRYNQSNKPCICLKLWLDNWLYPMVI